MNRAAIEAMCRIKGHYTPGYRPLERADLLAGRVVWVQCGRCGARISRAARWGD